MILELAAGRTIGSWTLQEPDSTCKYHWIALCICGNLKSVRNSSLKAGRSTGCGHTRTQNLTNRKTHGLTDSPEYRHWLWMRSRVKRPDYRRKGITVCARWQDFSKFLADMGQKPKGSRVSIERLDNTGKYEPGNCVWATPTVQNRNKATSVNIESKNHGSKSLAEWVWFLIENTNDTTWTPKKLRAALTAISLDQLLKALDIPGPIAECAIEPDPTYEDA